MKNIFITGVSSGLGLELCKMYLKTHRVFALSRSNIPICHDNLSFVICDLSSLEGISNALSELLSDVDAIDVAILNAGIVDSVKTMSDTSMQDLFNILNINTFSNKMILDFFIQNNIDLKQVLGISSGASIHAFIGMGGYCLSKSSLNMLLALYAKEMQNTHFLSLAPGVMETKIVAKVLSCEDKRFTSVETLKQADKTSLEDVSTKIISNMQYFKSLDSGAYFDIRDM